MYECKSPECIETRFSNFFWTVEFSLWRMTHGIKVMFNTKQNVISLIGNRGNKTTLMEHFMLDKCCYDTCTDTWNQSNLKY